MGETQTPPQNEVVLTDKAAQVIHAAFEAEQVDGANSYVRVGAKPGGCSGYKFTIDFSDASQVGESDVIFNSKGIRLVVDRDCLAEVLGSVEVDYQDQSMVEQGFSFRQLNDAALCGCGQSFAPVGQAED